MKLITFNPNAVLTVNATVEAKPARVYTYTNFEKGLVSNPDKVRNLLYVELEKQEFEVVRTCKVIRANIAQSVKISVARSAVLIRDNIVKVQERLLVDKELELINKAAQQAKAKKATTKKATAKKAVAKKATVKKTVAKKATAKKATVKKTVAKKATAKKATAK